MTSINMAMVTVKGTDYHIDDKLFKNWNKLKDGKLKKKDEDRVFIVDGREGCQPKGSKVLLANGDWKNIEDIKKGDEVLSPQEDGSYIFSKVLHIIQFKSKNIYDVMELHRQNRKLYSCSYNHEIPMNVKNRKTKKWNVQHYMAEDFYKKSKLVKELTHNSTSPSAFSIDKFKDRNNCEIEPYTLGVFLGDGCFVGNFQPRIKKEYYNVKGHYRNMKDGKVKWQSEHLCKNNRECKGTTCKQLSICCADFEIIEEVSKVYPVMTIQRKINNKASSYMFSLNGELAKGLTKIGLYNHRSGDKFIPKEALLSDVDYRKRLLAGLIDTDGTLSRSKGYSICTKSKKLAEDINSLIYSLGGRASITKIKKGIKKIGFIGEYYNISFYLGKVDLPLQVKRKIKAEDSKYFYLSASRTSITLKKKPSDIVYGFTLDSNSHWYITDNWMITKNTGKSVFAIQQAAYIDETILDDMSKITFTAEQTLNAIRNTKSTLEHTKCVIFDEAFKGLASRSAVSKINKMVIQALMEMRQNNLVLFIVLPSFFMLDLYPAVSRSTSLLHISKAKGSNLRSFRVFNYAKKARLYDLGLKKGWNYKVYTTFKGRFPKAFPGGDKYYENYLKVKQDALILTTTVAKPIDPDAGVNKFELKFREKHMNLLVNLQKTLGYSDKEMEELSKGLENPINASMMPYYRGKVAKLMNN